MQWRALFSNIESMAPAQVREFITRRPGSSFQLVDVRQPGEYAQAHLPGAQLIPLKELPDRMAALDPQKPTIVYCASGGRSRAAAQLMQGKGFTEVYNMPGGIKAWDGEVAAGTEEVGMELFTGNEDYEDGASLAYAMEEGLRQFYLRLAERTKDGRERALFNRLADFEVLHKERLLKEFQKRHGSEATLTEMPFIMEGGRRIEASLQRAVALLLTLSDILDLAMALETQALDLYSRMARKSNNPEVRDFFLSLADEEQGHLNFLTEELDRQLAVLNSAEQA